MPTIRQMYGGVYSLYKTQYSNGQLFRQTASSTQKNSSSLWSAASSLNSLTSMTSSARDLLSTYNTTKNTFNSEFDETMTALKNSAREIKNYDFNVGENAVTKTESIGEDGEKIISTKYSDKLTDALKAVESFVSNYNDAIDFLGDNSSVSKRVSRLATNFSDTTYRSKIYESVGLAVAKDGTMKIDEDKLVDAITKDPNKVSRILGKDGLAGKAESHVSMANSMRDNLFPTAKTMLGKDLSMASVYNSRSFLNMNSYSSLGSLINLMF